MRRLEARTRAACDFIFATTGIEAEIVRNASATEVFADVLVPTATAEALLAMKTLASTPQRPRDAGDIRAIVLANPDFDEAKVIEYLRTIAQRGCARGQDLEEKWRRLRRELGV
ncbi:MAG: hypothetical protein SF187_10470 [Deltaproteobacteria bacterium]|nr:hypothetical protein [Deltaproteobacteria bacterium]